MTAHIFIYSDALCVTHNTVSPLSLCVETIASIIILTLEVLSFFVSAASASSSPGRMSIVGVVLDVVRTERVRGLWRGVTPSVARTVPGVGLYFSVLHAIKTRWDVTQVRKSLASRVRVSSNNSEVQIRKNSKGLIGKNSW